MERISNNRRIQEIELKNNLKLYINIREDAKQEMDIYFDLQSQFENNRSITIELTNFKDKNGKDIIAKIIGTELENDDKSNHYKFTIKEKKIIKVQFMRENLIQNCDFNEINFDIIIGKELYSFKWNYHNKELTRSNEK